MLRFERFPSTFTCCAKWTKTFPTNFCSDGYRILHCNFILLNSSYMEVRPLAKQKLNTLVEKHPAGSFNAEGAL